MQAFLRPADVRKGRGISEATLYRLIAQRLLPKPVRISSRAVAWPVNEVEAIDRARIAGRTDDEIRRLVSELEAARQPQPGASK
jgi:prophage regulatory protein